MISGQHLAVAEDLGQVPMHFLCLWCRLCNMYHESHMFPLKMLKIIFKRNIWWTCILLAYQVILSSYFFSTFSGWTHLEAYWTIESQADEAWFSSGPWATELASSGFSRIGVLRGFCVSCWLMPIRCKGGHLRCVSIGSAPSAVSVAAEIDRRYPVTPLGRSKAKWVRRWIEVSWNLKVC